MKETHEVRVHMEPSLLGIKNELDLFKYDEENDEVNPLIEIRSQKQRAIRP